MEVWDLYFAALAGMLLHPGAGTRGHTALTLEECAEIADNMIQIREQRLCQHGSAQ